MRFICLVLVQLVWIFSHNSFATETIGKQIAEQWTITKVEDEKNPKRFFYWACPKGSKDASECAYLGAVSISEIEILNYAYQQAKMARENPELLKDAQVGDRALAFAVGGVVVAGGLFIVTGGASAPLLVGAGANFLRTLGVVAVSGGLIGGSVGTQVESRISTDLLILHNLTERPKTWTSSRMEVVQLPRLLQQVRDWSNDRAM